jgi:hypothetical protein
MPNRASYVQHIVNTSAVEGILAAPSLSTKHGLHGPAAAIAFGIGVVAQLIQFCRGILADNALHPVGIEAEGIRSAGNPTDIQIP